MMKSMKKMLLVTSVILCSAAVALAKPIEKDTVDPAPVQWFGTSLTIIVIFVICVMAVSVVKVKRGHAD